jgi:lipopolysaccharide transport system ATP-binding protein
MALIPGRYRLTLYSTVDGVIADWIKNAVVFDVEAGDFYGSGQLPPHGQGMFLLEHRFVVNASGVEFDLGDAVAITEVMQ